MVASAARGAERSKNIRDYDKARMHGIALALWGVLLTHLKDEAGTVYMPSGEILDALSMVGGMMLCSHPDSKVPSRLREMTEAHAKRMRHDTNLFMQQDTKSIFDVIMTDEDTIQ